MSISLIQLVFLGILFNEVVTQENYTAAVFDKAPVSEYRNWTVPTRKEALEMVRPNLELYAEQAAEAGKQVNFPYILER